MPSKSRMVRLFVGVVAPGLLLGLSVLIAVSPVPMRGAEMFGVIANKIKGNPGATAYWTLFAGSMLWVVIGLIAAVQEWRFPPSTFEEESSRGDAETRR